MSSVLVVVIFTYFLYFFWKQLRSGRGRGKTQVDCCVSSDGRASRWPSSNMNHPQSYRSFSSRSKGASANPSAATSNAQSHQGWGLKHHRDCHLSQPDLYPSSFQVPRKKEKKGTFPMVGKNMSVYCSTERDGLCPALSLSRTEQLGVCASVVLSWGQKFMHATQCYRESSRTWVFPLLFPTAFSSAQPICSCLRIWKVWAQKLKCCIVLHSQLVV